MTTAGQIAIELRKLADALEREPEASIDAPIVSWYYWGESQKDAFKATTRGMSKPLEKSINSGDLKVEYKSDAITIRTTIPQSVSCTLLEPAKPAKYRCDPILSDGEAETLGNEELEPVLVEDDIPF